MMGSPIQTMSPQEILDRVRKDLCYSALTTMLMHLMKEYGIYKNFKRTAILLQIPTQKNYSQIALALSMLFKNLMGKKYECTPKTASDFLCNKLRNGLNDTLKKSCCMKNGKDPLQLITVAETLILDDIEIFRKILSTDPGDIQMIEKFVRELYHNNKSKRKWISKVTHIFSEQRKDLESTKIQDQILPSIFEQYKQKQDSVKILTLKDLFDNEEYYEWSFLQANHENQYYRDHISQNQWDADLRQ